MYSAEAVRRRRCQAQRRDGEPCQGWARWGDTEQRCAHHASRQSAHIRSRRAGGPNYPPCQCLAYQWPHRPGGGLCRWPEPPTHQLTTPAGEHAWPRATTTEKRLIRLLSRRLGW